MKSIFAAIATTLLVGVSQAADCQDLSGSFFYSHNPSQTVTIEQSNCVLTMTYANSGNVGKPVQHFGDGVWRLVRESKFEIETRASFGSATEYRVETKTEMKDSKTQYHQVQTYKLRADGNVLMKSVITSGNISDSGMILLIRE